MIAMTISGSGSMPLLRTARRRWPRSRSVYTRWLTRGRWDTIGRGQDPVDRGRVLRPVHEVPLAEVAVELARAGPAVPAARCPRDGLEVAGCATDLDDRRRRGPSPSAPSIASTNARSILRMSIGKRCEVAERRVAGPEVVDREPDAERLERAQRVDRRRVGRRIRTLSVISRIEAARDRVRIACERVDATSSTSSGRLELAAATG